MQSGTCPTYLQSSIQARLFTDVKTHGLLLYMNKIRQLQDPPPPSPSSQAIICSWEIRTFKLEVFCFILFCFVLFCFFVFQDRVSPYSSGCTGAHFVDQAGLELRNPLASASRVLGLKACTTMPGRYFCFIVLLSTKSLSF
jgi:hypothetical protein